MFDITFNIVAFIIALGVLITFHEYGHYWVAKKLGVKVLRFSIGFGTPLWKRTAGPDNTEFVVAAIPLGGYVKMLDEREGEVDVSEQHRAFNKQSVGRRMAIVAAGPIANFLLAIATYWLMFVIGISGIVPVIGEIKPGSIAERAGFTAQETIVSVNSSPVESWDGVRLALLGSSLGDSGLDADTRVAVEVTDQFGLNQMRYINESFSHLLQDEGDLIRNLGLSYWWPTIDPIVAGVQENSPAEAAGLQAGDRFLSVNQTDISDWLALVKLIRKHPGERLDIVVERNGLPIALEVTTGTREIDGVASGFIGAWEEQSSAIRQSMRATTRYGILGSFSAAMQRSWEMSALTLQMLGKLVTGQAALSNISGPVTIAQFAGQSAAIGFDHYLSFIAIISISLGILNLLPIPVLDGGHLLYFAIEWIKGSPLSDSLQLVGQQLGIVLLGGLMCLAFYNDIGRLMQ